VQQNALIASCQTSASAGGTKWDHTNEESYKPKQKDQVLVQPVLCPVCHTGLNCSAGYRASLVQQLQVISRGRIFALRHCPVRALGFSCPPSFARCPLKGVSSAGWCFQQCFPCSLENSYEGLGKSGSLCGNQGRSRGEGRLGNTATSYCLALLCVQFWSLITNHLTPCSAILHHWFVPCPRLAWLRFIDLTKMMTRVQN